MSTTYPEAGENSTSTIHDVSERYHTNGNGYVKIYRKLLSSSTFTTPSANLLKVWLWCLLRANWTETSILFEGKELKLKRGQFATGRYSGSKECSMSGRTFHFQLRKLQEIGNITLLCDNKKTLVTVENYGSYQDEEVLHGQQIDNKLTPNGQQIDNRLTQIRSKEDKEVKKVRRERDAIPLSLEEVIELFKKRDYQDSESEAESFWNYYQSNGWVIGRARTPCRDWKAAAANWNKNTKQWRNNNGTNQRSTQSNYGKRVGVTADDLRRAAEEVRRRVGE